MWFCKNTYKNKVCPSLAKVVHQFPCPLPNFSKGTWMYSFTFQTLLFGHGSHQYHYPQCFCISFPCNGILWVSQHSSSEIIDRLRSESTFSLQNSKGDHTDECTGRQTLCSTLSNDIRRKLTQYLRTGHFFFVWKNYEICFPDVKV